MLPNAMHLIRVRYLPATNTKPARIKLTSLRFEDSRTFSYWHYDEGNGSLDKAHRWLTERGFTAIGIADDCASSSDSFVIVKELVSLTEMSDKFAKELLQ